MIMSVVYTGMVFHTGIMIECMGVCKHWTGQLDYWTTELLDCMDYWTVGPRADPGGAGRAIAQLPSTSLRFRIGRGSFFILGPRDAGP